MYICSIMDRFLKFASSVSFAVALFLFWWLIFPQALGFMEQNQLFLYTWAFLLDSLSVAGGFAGWISDFLIQFSNIPVLGAAIMALLLSLMQVQVYSLCRHGKSALTYPLSFIPSLLALLGLGDYFTQPALPVAVCMSLAFCSLYRRFPYASTAAISIPLSLWLTGPAAWIFVIYSGVSGRKWYRPVLFVAYGVLVTYLYALLPMCQYPLCENILGITYYSIPLEHPVLHHILIASAVLVPLLAPLLPSPAKIHNVFVCTVLLALFGITAAFVPLAYDKGSYEVIAYDQLVRNEKWNEVIARAEKYQPAIDVGCVSVNLSLIMSGQVDRIGEFVQLGTRGLLMPRVRDYISNASTGEAFFRMGFINEALRYAFDTQEAIPNLKKSGRWLKRMAECQILNGRYEVASKYIDILKHTIFYREWAFEEERLLGNERLISENPLYAYLLSIRSQEDYLYYYPNMENMLGKLYIQNNDNILAGIYCSLWHQFKDKSKENEKTETLSGHGN